MRCLATAVAASSSLIGPTTLAWKIARLLWILAAIAVMSDESTPPLQSTPTGASARSCIRTLSNRRSSTSSTIWRGFSALQPCGFFGLPEILNPPEPAIAAAAPGRDDDDGARRDDRHVLVERVTRGRAAEPMQVGRDREHVGLEPDPRSQRADLRSEDERVVAVVDVERLDPEPIPRESQRALVRVVEREREHPLEARQRRIEAAVDDRLEQHLGVAGRSERHAVGLELGAKLAEIVDFAVEDQAVAAVAASQNG